MKNLLAVLILFLATTTYAQVDLKGVEIGTKNTKFKNGVNTTLVGEEWLLMTYHLNDGRIYLIGGIPADGENVRRVYKSELDRLIKAVESKFNLTLKYISKDDYSDDGSYYAYKDDYTFLITADHNKYKDIPYEITFTIQSDVLAEIHDSEQQAKANQDL